MEGLLAQTSCSTESSPSLPGLLSRSPHPVSTQDGPGRGQNAEPGQLLISLAAKAIQGGAIGRRSSWPGWKRAAGRNGKEPGLKASRPDDADAVRVCTGSGVLVHAAGRETPPHDRSGPGEITGIAKHLVGIQGPRRWANGGRRRGEADSTAEQASGLGRAMREANAAAIGPARRLAMHRGSALRLEELPRTSVVDLSPRAFPAVEERRG